MLYIVFNLTNTSYYLVIITFSSLFLSLFILTICGHIVVRALFFVLILFYLYYWLNSTFIFLYKKAQYGIFVTSIKRFWSRALNLFWLLEFFLFSIYLYLFLIAPQEVMYMHDNISATFSYFFNLGGFFKNLLTLLFILLIGNLFLLFTKFNNVKYFLLLLLFVLLLFTLHSDFFQYFSITQFYNNLNWVFDFSSNLWQLELSTIKTRTIIHYFYLLIFLKFWHTIFIIGFFIFFFNIFLHTEQFSLGTFGGNFQNFLFLFFFGFILKIVGVKYYLNYIYEYVYFWFFQDFHFFDNNFFFHIVTHPMYFFFIRDVKFVICDLL